MYILIQNGIEAPVICFESDGHINIEAGCNSICAVPIQKPDEHYDDCDNCFDIHFWKYNSVHFQYAVYNNTSLRCRRLWIIYQFYSFGF